MKSFMSAQLQNTAKPTTSIKGATECTSCGNEPVRTSGQESVEQTADNTNAEGVKPVAEQPPKENQVVVMQGPLGSAITEALNKKLSKKALTSNVQVPGAAMEDNSALDYIQANGQINNTLGFVTKLSKAVGLVPMTDEKPTAVNTLLDCARKVDDIEFILVNRMESSPSEAIVPQKSLIHEVVSGSDSAGLESLVVDSVQVVVTYRKVAKNSA